MGKRKIKELHKEIYDAILYKWEFVRRSPKYQRDYLSWFRAKNKKRAEELRRKYGFLPFNYKLSAKKMFTLASAIPINKKEFSSDEEDAMLFVAGHSIVGLIANEDSWSKNSLSIYTSDLKKIKFQKIDYSNKNLEDINTLRISLNLRYSKEKLLYWVGRIIDDYKNRGAGQEGRNRFDMYDTYLQIYDLKNNNPKMSFEEITERVYPKDYDNSLGLKPKIDYWSLIQRVKREFKEAKKLIEGGYRQIR